ncbi:four helix bundle protein [Arcticibacter tournemirensis]|uniref:Four helix bundle protein n=1 Tax=Arcticibacter tournemirensis TaxID=699437 RepID=A0A4Q0M752_9SPHI|nr:four helix bundle protein [Arcticibacter tournemirensis]RXF68910.1 four helix bundle protein [Arcticibacter tournemirensis]
MKAVSPTIEKNVVAPKSVLFALKIMRLYEKLCSKGTDRLLATHLLQSGTSIGTLVREAELTESKPEFLDLINRALKDAQTAARCLLLLKEGSYIHSLEYGKLNADCDEITTLLTEIIDQLQ